MRTASNLRHVAVTCSILFSVVACNQGGGSSTTDKVAPSNGSTSAGTSDAIGGNSNSFVGSCDRTLNVDTNGQPDSSNKKTPADSTECTDHYTASTQTADGVKTICEKFLPSTCRTSAWRQTKCATAGKWSCTCQGGSPSENTIIWRSTSISKSLCKSYCTVGQ